MVEPKAPSANGLLAELLGRLEAVGGGAVELTASELDSWPAAEVTALKVGGFLVPGKPGVSAQCPGCEQACMRPVEEAPRAGRSALLFIVCDKRDDIASVPVPAAAVERWRLTGEGLAAFLARSMGGESASHAGASDGRPAFRLGVVSGKKEKGAVYLAWSHSGPCLKVAGHEVELLLALDLVEGQVVLNLGPLRRCVDAPARAAEAAEPPEDRRLRLLALVAEERGKNPHRFLAAAAKRADMTVYALKQVIYRKPKAANAIESIARGLRRPVSGKTKSKR